MSCGLAASPDIAEDALHAAHDAGDRAQLGYPPVVRGLMNLICQYVTWRLARQRVDFSNTLEVGAGAGRLAHVLRHRGCYVTAIDPHSSAPGVLNSRTSDLIDHSDRYSAIVYWHVLEHIPRPNAELRAAAALLRPGGSLVIAVPDPTSVQSHMFGAAWRGWNLPEHRFHFSRPVLTELLTSVGLQARTLNLSGGHTLAGWMDGPTHAAAGSHLTEVWSRGGVRNMIGRLTSTVTLPLAVAARCYEVIFRRTGAFVAVGVGVKDPAAGAVTRPMSNSPLPASSR
ncbi:class I SAM-dependent methyltransferase [Nocardia sp. NPDC051321]|uniref:class I SAM-dependent methyltransferase n=1 Tax=Nocardia sp. NPDC051321 TaxID=3364323 RepID=UPI0037B49C55